MQIVAVLILLIPTAHQPITMTLLSQQALVVLLLYLYLYNVPKIKPRSPLLPANGSQKVTSKADNSKNIFNFFVILFIYFGQRKEAETCHPAYLYQWYKHKHIPRWNWWEYAYINMYINGKTNASTHLTFISGFKQCNRVCLQRMLLANGDIGLNVA